MTTASELADWPRPRYTPGGKPAFLFYIVYGRIDFTTPPSRSRYRLNGIPDGIEIMAYGPEANPEQVSVFREGYLWNQVKAEQPDLAVKIAEQDSCLVVRGEVIDPPTLNYFRDIVGFLTFCLDAGGVAIYDPQMFAWWSPSHWRSEAFDIARPAPRHHVTILLSDEPDRTEWIHTRGMRKFGRPDISVHGVRAEYKEPVIELCKRFIEFLASGEIVPDGQEIRMKALPSGMTCIRQGNEDDPDFNNEHIEILWPTSLVP